MVSDADKVRFYKAKEILDKAYANNHRTAFLFGFMWGMIATYWIAYFFGGIK